jgi:hypothetical protein
MEMGVDEAGKNGLSATRESLCVRGDKRVQLPRCPNRQDLPGGNRHSFGKRTGWVEGEDAPAVEQKVGGGGENFFPPLPRQERAEVRVFHSHIATLRTLTLTFSLRERGE